MKSIVLIKIICTDALPRLKLPVAAIAPVQQDVKGLWAVLPFRGERCAGCPARGDPQRVSTDPGADLLPLLTSWLETSAAS